MTKLFSLEFGHWHLCLALVEFGVWNLTLVELCPPNVVGIGAEPN